MAADQTNMPYDYEPPAVEEIETPTRTAAVAPGLGGSVPLGALGGSRTIEVD